MSTGKQLFALGGGLLLSVAGLAAADTQATELQSEVAALRARIAQLENRQSQNWVDARRADEVKALVKEVLADADTRASLQGGGMPAGWSKDKGFFLASEDGSFLLRVKGYVQFRYIANWRDDNSAGAAGEDVNGFELRRTKGSFDGHIGGPQIEYAVTLSADRSSGAVAVDQAKLGYKLTEDLKLVGGRLKAPFLKEELVSATKQLAVERSFVNERFTSGYVEGVGLEYAQPMWKAAVMFHDGQESGEVTALKSPTVADGTDLAASARLDVKLMGDWKQADDFAAWSGGEAALFVGAGVTYESSTTNTTAANDELLAWTVDALFKSGGFSAFVAGIGRHNFYDDVWTVDDTTQWGVVAQASYMVIPDKLEPFVRWEYLDANGTEVNPGNVVPFAAQFGAPTHIFTFGANYYLKKHDAKFTLDVVWAPDSVPFAASETGLGLVSDEATLGGENQIALRAQFQLQF